MIAGDLRLRVGGNKKELAYRQDILKSRLSDRLYVIQLYLVLHRVRGAITMGAYLVQDDVSTETVTTVLLLPEGPWHASLSTIRQQLPQVQMSMILSYLAKATHQPAQTDKFRALTRGYNLWKSKHVSQAAVHFQDAAVVWVRSVVYASYKKEKRTSHVAFGRISQTVDYAHCTCPAGLSAVALMYLLLCGHCILSGCLNHHQPQPPAAGFNQEGSTLKSLRFEANH